jgi:hypothetical protein
MDSKSENASLHAHVTQAMTAEEQRWARRHAARFGGQITHPSLTSPILCTVRDTSSTGAKLELSKILGGSISRDRAPDRFTLFMPAERLTVECEVAWRRGNMLGVRYTTPARKTAKQALQPRLEAKKPGISIFSKLINP